MKINYIKLTAYICTFLVFFLAIYDGVSISLSGSIASSVSIWFAGFGCYFTPMFGMSFLLGHFFGVKPVKNAPIPPHMSKLKFGCTLLTIVATLYDILVIQFINNPHPISSIPLLMEISKFPLIVILFGLLCGKYLGTMSPTRPAGEK